MPSIISGFEYDIFISYRQKDNKHDGWVTEFVNQLKGEIEATFKEDISIYFDENPHDGLLETHNVDKSLEAKLKCLIFIPIISQTYCDSKSFAWQHEFCAFNKLAKEDQFGRDIKLSSGNVAGRILPVKIHDLDPEDKTLLENELGGPLRGIEFIYKEAGVNRPLKPNDDPKENLNKTNYINQVNKVANASKEIITALKRLSQHIEEVSKQTLEVKPAPQKNPMKKIIAGFIILLALIIVGYFYIPKLFKSYIPLEKTIAVLPFRNLSNDSTQLYFCDGFMEEILNNLQRINSFTVRSRTSSDHYRSTKKSIIAIGNELNVNYLVEGSVGREGGSIKIWVQLIDSKADKHIWSNDYTRESKQIFSLQSEIAKDIASELKTVLSSKEKVLIEKNQTGNIEAYDLYLRGRYFWYKRNRDDQRRSIEYFEKSVRADTNYALAYSGLADAYYYQAWSGWVLPRDAGYARAKKYAMKAIALNNDIAEAHATLGEIYCWSEWKWEEARKELKLAIELDPNCLTAHFYYSQLLDVLRENKEARQQINIALKIDPFFAMLYYVSGLYYYHTGSYNESLNNWQKMLELDAERSAAHFYCFLDYIKLGENIKAVESFQKFMQLHNDTLSAKYSYNAMDVYNKSGFEGILNLMLKWVSETQNKSYLGGAMANSLLGNKKETLDCLEKAFEQRSPEIPRINNSPYYEFLRKEPRFQVLINKMGLTDYQMVK